MKIIFFKKQVAFIFLIPFFFATCTNKKQEQTIKVKATTEKYTAPTITQINQLHDTLQPKKTYLKNVLPPKVKKVPPSGAEGAPNTHTFAPNIAQGVAHFTTYTSDAGLAMDAISFGHKSSICDNEGNIWFATQGGGVSKYDGESFTSFTVEQGLANNSVFSIAEDKSGNLWFGTYGGVSKYDGESFTSFTVEQGLANNYVLSIAEDKSGNLWFGTNGGVSKYDGESFTSFTVEQGLANNYVRSIAEDKSGNLWFGTNGGVSKYDGESFTSFTVEQGLANNSVFSIAEDKSGNLWFGTDGGVSKYDGESFTSFTVEQGLANNYVLSIAEDKSGNLWFGTNGGVSKYDGESFTSFTVEQGLANNYVRSIAEDKSGNLWFGTDGGVSKYDGESFTSFTVEQGLANNYVRSIAEDKSGNLWFGTNGGVSKYDGESFTSFTVEQGLANNSVFSIAEDKSGNLWFGTYGGVSKYDGESFTSFTVEQGLANNYVLSIAEDKSGNLWFGTNGGVSKYDGESFTSFTVEQGLANNYVRSIAEDKSGNLWFGTNGGVSKYDGESFTSFTVEQGLANNSVFSIAEDKSGNLWFGTDQGLSLVVYQPSLRGTKQSYEFKNVTKQLKNLPDNVIGAIQFDKKGRMILGTNFGLYVLAATEVETLTKSTAAVEGIVYNQFTGYPVKDVNYGGNNNGATCIDKNGIYWVGHGSNGVTRVDLDAVHKSKAPPTMVINKVSLKGEDVCYYSLKLKVESSKLSEEGIRQSEDSPLEKGARGIDSTILSQQEITTYGKTLTQAERDTLQQRFAGITFDGITKFYPLPQNLVLPYKHNALTFEFNAIETGRNFMVNYQFALTEGNSPLEKGARGIDWSPITKKHEATYNNLWEGEYTFLLKGQNPWGVWSEPTLFTFTVLPPWHRTWWMYSVYAILALLAIWGLIQLQTKRLKQRQKELEVEVEKATQEIIAQKEEVEEKQKEILDSINYAERIQRSFLATKELLDENLKDYFVFFKPKDVVSGDFYWARKLNDGNFALLNADSTGHGVPGAIMSILNITSIEKAVETEMEPNQILNTTRKLIIERLKKDGSATGGKDGMDASLLIFDAAKTKLNFAAANNPVWVVRKKFDPERHAELDSASIEKKTLKQVQGDDSYELIEYKADRMPIGKGENNNESFTLQTIELQKGDVIYTLTDGFQDQFGGEKGKKFMVKKLKNLLLSITHLPMQEQEQKLDKVFAEWKGKEEQVDDVCIIGVRV